MKFWSVHPRYDDLAYKLIWQFSNNYKKRATYKTKLDKNNIEYLEKIKSILNPCCKIISISHSFFRYQISVRGIVSVSDDTRPVT